MLEEKYECEDDDPVDETDLDGFHTHVVLYVHYLLELFVTFTDLAPGILDVEIDSIKDSSLLND